MEFYTGDALFQTHDNLEHLAMMQAVVGQKIDTKLVRAVAGRTAANHTISRYGSSVKGSKTAGRALTGADRYFKGPRLDYPNEETTRASKKYVHAMKVLPVRIAICLLPAKGSPFNRAIGYYTTD